LLEAAHTAISWEAATASFKMDYSYDILISSLHGLQVQLVSRQIWRRRQASSDRAQQMPALHPSPPVVAPTDLQGAPASLCCAAGLHRLESKNRFLNQELCCGLLGNFPRACGRRMSLTGTEERILRKWHDRQTTHCRSHHLKLGNHPFQNLGITGVCPA